MKKFFPVIFVLIIFLFSYVTNIRSFKAAVIIGTPTPTSPPAPSNTPVPPTPVPPTAAPVPSATPVHQQQPSATPKPKSSSPTKAATITATTGPTALNTVTPSQATCILDASGENCVTPTPEDKSTTGYTVTIHVVRSDNQSMANSPVTIDGKSYLTDQDSNVTLKNMTIGAHQVTALINNNEQTQSFVLGTADINKEVTVVMQADSLIFLLILLVIFIIVITTIVFIYNRKRRNKQKVKNQSEDFQQKKPVDSGKT